MGGERPLTDIITEIERIRSKFLSSSEESRTLQAAYNTIKVVASAGPTDDISKAKIAALVCHLGFDISYSSETINIEDAGLAGRIHTQAAALPEGVFLLRILQDADNHKREVQGHSMVYIRERESDFLCDPNYGLNTFSREESTQILSNSFRNCFEAFRVDKARFYQLTER